MNYFKYRKKDLFCEGVNLQSLAQKKTTPFFVYTQAGLTGRFEELKKAFQPLNPLICYSVKCNSNLSVLDLLRKKGCGFDIVSGGELYRVKKIRADMQKVVYAGVGKTEEDISQALQAGIFMFNCESVNEIRRVHMIARRLKMKAKIAVRINPDVDAKTHKYITTGKKESKFGVPFSQLLRMLKEVYLLNHVELSGVHIHIGSQITTVKPYREAVKKVLDYVDVLRKKGFLIRTFNLGGGFGIRYKNEKEKKAEDFARALIPLFRGQNLQVIMEPGRYIAGNAGALITRIQYLKKGKGKNFIVTDAGMNDLIRPSLYGSWHEVIPVHAEGQSMKADVVGPVCETGDFFALGRRIGPVQEGSCLAVLSAGAYGAAMSSRYNSHPLAAEYLVSGLQARLIRERETEKDMIRKEVIL